MSKCFICGLDRFTFDTRGRGFERHVLEDHNAWAYLHMAVHLREKEPGSYSGWEHYVMAKLRESDTSFVPRNVAIVLKEYKEREEAAKDEQHNRLMKAVEQVSDDNSRLQKMVMGLAESLDDVRRNIDAISAAS